MTSTAPAPRHPRVSSVWRHRTKQTRYHVVMLTNEHSTQPDRYPVTVVYRDREGHDWSRPLHDWHRSMEHVSDPVTHGVPVSALEGLSP